MSLDSQPKNPRGIPSAPFISDPVAYLEKYPSVEAALSAFNDALAKYRYMESNLASRKKGLEDKIPEIRKTLDVVTVLKKRREKAKGEVEEEDDLDDEDEGSGESKFKTTFELNDTLYAEAEIEDTDEVYLWLGANTMLSYPLPEAQSLLTQKLSDAEQNLNTVIEDMEFLKEQITVMEVNTARVYNHDVKRRREESEAAGPSASKSKS